MNLLHFIRSRMVEKQYTLSKLHSNYGKLFSEWSVIEKEMGDGLQKAGHYFGNLFCIIFMFVLMFDKFMNLSFIL